MREYVGTGLPRFDEDAMFRVTLTGHELNYLFDEMRLLFPHQKIERELDDGTLEHMVEVTDFVKDLYEAITEDESQLWKDIAILSGEK